MPDKVVASAPGNVFFMGEHAVVYHRPAIVTAVSMRTYTTAQKSMSTSVVVGSAGYGNLAGRITDYGLEFSICGEELQPAKELLEECYEHYGMDDGVRIDVRSDIPHTTGGLSSSTAFLSSFFHALNELYGWGISKERYLEILLPFQEKIHGGAASGAEFASSVFGGTHIVRKKPNSSSGELPIDMERVEGDVVFHLVIGDTGIRARTSTTVGEIKKLREMEEEPYEEVFDEIESVVKEGVSALKNADAVALGELMNRNAQLLEKLDEISMALNKKYRVFENFVPIVTEKLKLLMNAALSAGALGAKPSGGGGGGIMIALADDYTVEAVRDTLLKCAARVYVVDMGVEGVTTLPDST